MNIKQLQIYLDLSESLHFGRTADAHHMSPSTLSRLIQRLEQDAGVSLLARNKRQVSLTAAGRDYASFAQNCLAAWRNFEASQRGQREDLHGDVSLYCSVTASHSLLAPFLSRLGTQQPGIEIKLHTGDQALSLQRLQAGSEDMVIAARPERLPGDIAFRPLAATPLVFIAPAEAPDFRLGLEQLASPGNVDASVAANSDGQAGTRPTLPWVMSEQGLTRQRLDAWLRQRRIKPQIYAQVSGHEAIVSMVALGCGVGVVPQLVLAKSPLRDSIEVVSLTPSLQDFHIGLCVLRRRLHENLLQAVWDSIAAGSETLAL